MMSRRERCGDEAKEDGAALIRSHGGTFCGGCAAEMDRARPNRGGGLARQPRRETA
ncbi:MAG: hypothetical protein AVDCRST_MAG22-1915 [uncultured Rubrobacteraceae bacterium]|uniref:Uncharacterized protein n=1 Tax=uncultured Rubrobacteraceae bacterium TaxID=349277 RepID=A0A6N3ITT7_9ACTN|nr:MAG: hypothetical protein AVDCRST_MAG22-1915 [uncultured Rubrobacteraceae bacterium]